MGAKRAGQKAGALARLALFALAAALAGESFPQQPPTPERLSFSPAEQEAYMDGLIRNAPKDWTHGKNWVLIQPYLIARNVTQPISRIVCPDAGIADPTANAAQIPPWIYSAPGICEELAATHDAAVLVLEDPSDMNAAYFLFLACDTQRRRNPCEMDGYYQQDGMKLEESKKHGRREFGALVPNLEGKTSHFLVSEIWHVRNIQPEPQPGPELEPQPDTP
jgi:hypothetical protein